MVNPQWLKTFALLAKLGNFTRTAEKLGLTQAAVSQHLRHLEAEYGALLIRKPRRIELTATGRALLDYYDEINRADHRLQQRIADADEEDGDITLMTPGSVGLVLYPLLLDLQEARPGLTVRHRFASDRETLEAVLQSQCEIGLVTSRPDHTQIEARYFAQEPLELVVPAKADIGSWQDLAELGFIDHPDGQAMAQRLLSRQFSEASHVANLRRVGFVNQMALILEPVARGLGFTVIPRYARQAFADQSRIRVMTAPVAVIDTLWLIHRAEWSVSRRATHAIDYLQQRLGEHPL
ncbi:LysR family transcriptional regulator [Robbsia andropogonis]|uniref:LysR family transcriptional regulator n=1 Tax=Robbsia andropogonis TaxID=28092 RepID=A0A0F5K4W6_9BURK|nr:LysR family transcriptional regulator [Robbsia andropogonis]KKB64995.1 LysR family transcriptional regulator [Robbsia andropogonis]MCP1118559.1 LysR family transcriptional regulator [Robbsia andropogonis]MCP1128026.1 LysR family transcriptional regulator [Robbsia andropogonis]